MHHPMNTVSTGPGDVLVYAFEFYDAHAQDALVAPYKAPLPWIEEAGHRALLGTAEAVPQDALDAQGRYRRIATGWGALD